MPLPPVTLVSGENALAASARALASAERVALDVESNGMFVYRARACVVQLAADDSIVVVDPLACALDPLASLLAGESPIKIVHDVAFDARILADAGLALAGVHDTAICARMLGRTSTGLASLLASELEVTIGKDMQQHDWSLRPLDERALSYLATDVAYLAELDDVLFTEARDRGIEAEVLCETRYRIACAQAAAREGDPRPPYVRVKGIEKAPAADLPILRELAAVREREAEARDVPPHRVMSADALYAVARARPQSTDALRAIRGVPHAMREPLARAFVDGVREGALAGAIPDDERATWFERPRLPPADVKARRERESRLMAWRREEAKQRGVDEQVVLPGHCLKDAVSADATTRERLAAIAGIGDFRVERYGDVICAALAVPAVEAT